MEQEFEKTFCVTEDMTFESLEKIPLIREAAPYLIGGDGMYYDMVRSLPLSQGTVLGWNADTMIEGMEYLLRRAAEGEYLYRVYDESEWAADPAKKDVNIIYFPANRREEKQTITKQREEKEKPYLFICPGGAYVNVCSISEGYPVAKEWNALGYDVFVVNYRVGAYEVMPKPLDDLAACIRYVRSHAKQFHIADPDRYMVCGFSAGGNLTALWGTKNHGYASYGLPKPVALFPVYPVSDLHLFDGLEEETIETFLKTLLGDDITEERLEEYSVLSQMDKDYPPCYVACCRDDETVPCVNSEKLYERLQELGIPSVLEMGEHGGHGFGDGRFADTKGWISRAAAFAEKMSK